LSNEEVYAKYVEAHDRNEIDLDLVKCPICGKCKAYRVRINDRTHIYVTQCRKLKIIESQVKNPDDWWLIDFDDFLNPQRKTLEDFF
jgi:hypothetical protein